MLEVNLWKPFLVFFTKSYFSFYGYTCGSRTKNYDVKNYILPWPSSSCIIFQFLKWYFKTFEVINIITFYSCLILFRQKQIVLVKKMTRYICWLKGEGSSLAPWKSLFDCWTIDLCKSHQKLSLNASLFFCLQSSSFDGSYLTRCYTIVVA